MKFSKVQTEAREKFVTDAFYDNPSRTPKEVAAELKATTGHGMTPERLYGLRKVVFEALGLKVPGRGNPGKNGQQLVAAETTVPTVTASEPVATETVSNEQENITTATYEGPAEPGAAPSILN